jgi:hypothetical protein
MSNTSASRLTVRWKFTRERLLWTALGVAAAVGVFLVCLRLTEPKRLCWAFARSFLRGDERAALAMLPPGAAEENFLSDEILARRFRGIRPYLPSRGKLSLRNYRRFSRRWCSCEFEVVGGEYPVAPTTGAGVATFQVWVRRIGGRWEIAYPGSPFTDYMQSLYGVQAMQKWMAATARDVPAHREREVGQPSEAR